MAKRDVRIHDLVARELEVVEALQVTPRMRRVRLAGPQLGVFEAGGAVQPAFSSPAFDDHVKLVLATDGDVERARPVQLARGIEWPPAPNRAGRDYTPRRVVDGVLELDFVLHGEGPAAQWATSAQPGDTVCVVGPKTSTLLPDDVDWIWLVGDETAIPAIARFLEERPIDVPATIVVLHEHDDARQPLAVREGDALSWVRAAATDAAAVERAVRALPVPEGQGYAWAAAESRALLPVRRYLRTEVGLDARHINVTGYWAAETTVDEPPLPSPVPWLATRAAVRSGLLDAIAATPGLDAAGLAERVDGLSAGAIAALLPVLEHHGVVRSSDGIRLAGRGELLVADEHEREELEGHEADVVLALAALGEPGGSAWEAAHGRTLREEVAADAARYEELVHEATRLAFVLGALVADPVLAEAEHVFATGPGAAEIARALEGRDVTIVEDETPLAVLRETGVEGVRWSASSVEADVEVLALALEHRTDDESRALLAATAAPSVVVVESSKPDAMGLAALEQPATIAAINGAGFRDARAIAVLGDAVGLERSSTVPLGWGVEAHVLRRRSSPRRSMRV